MSLKSKLSGQSERNKEFQSIIRSIIPNKILFQTYSGKKPFGKDKDYEVLAPYKLSKASNASIVGMAFDYLARISVGQIISKKKEDSYLNLVAEKGLTFLKNELSKVVYKKLEKNYIEKLAMFIGYVHSDTENYTVDLNTYTDLEKKAYQITKNDNIRIRLEDKKILSAAIYFSKLEQIHRCKIVPEDLDELLLDKYDEEILIDLINLCDAFNNKFIDSGIVNENSDVVFNPHFGRASLLVGGADADIFIDGTLYDFKVTKSNGYKWQEFGQIIGYYLLFLIVKRFEYKESDLYNKEINKIALYKARVGEIEYLYRDDLDIEKINNAIEYMHNNFRNIFDLI